MKYFPHPRLKTFADIQVGELVTVFYAFGGEHSSRAHGIRINVTNATAILVLKAESTVRSPKPPFIYAVPRGNRLCASFGKDFIIESTTPPIETICDIGVHAGCLTYVADKCLIACRIPNTEQMGCISISDWSWEDGIAYGADMLQSPKWRVISLVQEHGISEIICWAEFNQTDTESKS